jgi:IS30 family transposase
MKLDDKVFDITTGKTLDKTYREYYELGPISLCEKTIYNAIHNQKIKDLKPYMMLLQYKKGKQYVFKEGKRINGDSIDLMPKEMFDRNIDGI